MDAETARAYLPFRERLRAEKRQIVRRPLETLQINVGKYCNQACHHCHVDAGPRRVETMDRRTVDRALDLVAGCPALKTIDITGGAPELNAHFRHLAREARALGKEVIDRCNLTVLLLPGQEDTASFLGEQRIHIIASLPCYSRENVEAQRGRGTFPASIRALQRLNALGYGREGTGCVLDLVYNPLGAFLPPDQATLEQEYREALSSGFGVVFNHLFTITNMPIKRFRQELIRTESLTGYMTTLAASFNSPAADRVMCRNLLSVGWDGQLYDCDFNQMLEIPAGVPRRTLWDIDSLTEFDTGPIAFADHCYGCTAGAGSSCGGALA